MRTPTCQAAIPQPHLRQSQSYIDGFVIAIPIAKIQKFIEHPRLLNPIFIELGAVCAIEALG